MLFCQRSTIISALLILSEVVQDLMMLGLTENTSFWESPQLSVTWKFVLGFYFITLLLDILISCWWDPPGIY